jgi:RNA-directed DNA polymerase
MEIGVGQLTLTFDDESIDEARETQDNGSATSPLSEVVRSKPERKKKWHSLIDKVYAPKNLEAAWQRVRSNAGSSGIDRMTVDQFDRNAGTLLTSLSADLRSKTYRPHAVRRVFIEKAGGGKRPLGIPTVRDRIVQQAILQVLEPIFDPKFLKSSHGFRKERGCHTALDVVDRAVRYGYAWVVDADIASFFDTVDHEKLIDAVAEEVADGSVLKLIRHILTAGVQMPNCSETEPTDLGTPQGGPLSPLLANIYLHAFDVEMKRAGVGLVRYADDFVIFAKSRSEADTALNKASSILEGKLGLRLHPEKTRIVTVSDGFEFLGYHYFFDAKAGQTRKEVRPKSVQRFRDAIRQRTPRLRLQRRTKGRWTVHRLLKNPRVQSIIESLNSYLSGWHGYFKHVWSPYETPFRDFDGFVRRRLRSSITGRFANGHDHHRLPNKLLKVIGLRSLDERYRTFKGIPVTTRKGQPGGEPYAGKPHVRFGKAGGWATTL